MTGRTGILYFARSPHRESQNKRVHPSSKANLRAISLLHEHTLQTLKASKLPFFQFSEQAQLQHGFGNRLATGLKQMFVQGYDQIIVVGNDCPDLTPGDLQSAAQHLANGDLVLGKDGFGGVYLIGITKKAFQEQAFRDLPWTQPELYPQLFAYFQQQGRVQHLAAKADLDDYLALQLWSRNRVQHSLARALASLSLTSGLPSAQFIFPTLGTSWSQLFFRGPPSPFYS